MDSTNTEMIKVLAEQIVGAIKRNTDANNKLYVNNQVKNAHGSGGGGMASSVKASNVIGLYDTVGNYIYGAWSATQDEIAKKIVEGISGGVYDTLRTIAEGGTIPQIDTEQLSADMADISVANITKASIKASVTDDALIYKGVAGEIYIRDLSVTEASIAHLSVGDLLVNNSDGELVKIIIDAQTGEIETELVENVDGGFIEDNTVHGTKIIDGTLNVDKLDAESIFADSAEVLELIAANINVDTLFAREAFVGKLQSEINSNAKLIFTKNMLELVVDTEESTSTSLVLTEKMLQAIADKVNVMANDINLSANNSVKLVVQNNTTVSRTVPTNPAINSFWLDTSVTPNLLKVYNGTTWVVPNNTEDVIDKVFDAEISIEGKTGTIAQMARSVETLRVDIDGDGESDGLKQRMNYAEQKLTPEGFNTMVLDNEHISAIDQTASKIDWIVASESTQSEVKMTDNALEAIADDINLSANESIVLNVKNNMVVGSRNYLRNSKDLAYSPVYHVISLDASPAVGLAVVGSAVI